MGEHKKQDLRVKKSKRAISEAFWQLMETGGFSNVNVSKIIELAEINRSTFYAHYLDKYDLMDKMSDELLGSMAELTHDVPVDSIMLDMDSNEAFRAHITTMLSYIKEHGDRFVLLAGADGDPAFASKLSCAIEEVWRDKGLEGLFTVPEDYLLAAISGMVSSLIARWTANSFEGGPDEFANTVVKIVSPIVYNTVKTPSSDA